VSSKNEAEFEISTLRYFKRVENGLKKNGLTVLSTGKTQRAFPNVVVCNPPFAVLWIQALNCYIKISK
jgi:uncharacterized protein (DUF302 family)